MVVPRMESEAKNGIIKTARACEVCRYTPLSITKKRCSPTKQDQRTAKNHRQPTKQACKLLK